MRSAPERCRTKGTLLRRDLGLLSQIAAVTDVSLAMSIGIFDEELQRSVEPGTPTTAARLATVRAIRERGLTCTVLLAPILPFLTDGTAHLDRALDELKAAGATKVVYTALYLRDGVKEWYMQWLAQAYPEHLASYQSLFEGGAYAPRGYRDQVDARMRELMRKHGFGQHGADQRHREPSRRPPVIPQAMPAPQPTLF
jgi:DNA repair photolyase